MQNADILSMKMGEAFKKEKQVIMIGGRGAVGTKIKTKKRIKKRI